MTQAPVFSTFDPSLLYSGDQLRISLPLGNVGTATAEQVRLTGVALVSATLVSPAFFPLGLGTLAVGNNVAVNAVFTAHSLPLGKKLLLTIRGTYVFGSAILGFTVNRFITVPAPAPFPFTLLKAHVQVNVQPNTWTYTIFNDEDPTSDLFVSAFALDVKVPFTVTAAPAGWAFFTDFASHILWYATDTPTLIANHIAPRKSVGGFQIQSSSSRSEATPYSLTSWNHGGNGAGPVVPDVVLSPAS